MEYRKTLTTMKLTQTMAAWRRGGVAALLLAGMSLVAVACGDGDERDKAEAAAKAFAEAYFNYDIAKAAQFCTDDSQRWLRFAAEEHRCGDAPAEVRAYND